MDRVRKEMLEIYKPISNLDWLNYRLVRSEVTFHHIQKHADKGKRVVENGALLMPVAHQYLHLIEYKDLDMYVEINRIFRLVNEQRFEPTYEQRELLECLLEEFEYKYRWEKSNKGGLLLQKKYFDRGFVRKGDNL